VAQTKITVTGMTCAHCERAVRAEISALPGVSQVDADASSGLVVIEADPVPAAADLRAAIAEAGYELAGPA
jgi:copper chaperone